ncbi:MAG TPA: penicillin-binding protein 2, partial [Opitutaceae bacterium]|nr:penicillin-binding protein 2 [Opitutaceae bacterium]
MSKGFTTSYRIALLATAVLAMFGGLEVRLVWLHVIDRDELLRSVDEARRQLIVDNARRGDIVDTHGALLATSRSIVVLGVDPQFARQEDRPKWAQLSTMIGVPMRAIEEAFMTKTRAAGSEPQARPGSPAGAMTITLTSAADAAVPAVDGDGDAEAKDDSTLDDPDKEGNRPIRWAKLSDQVPESVYGDVLKMGIKGVYGRRVYRRDYPHNEMAAHIIGYVDSGEHPIAGMEHYADFYLR